MMTSLYACHLIGYGQCHVTSINVLLVAIARRSLFIGQHDNTDSVILVKTLV